MRNFGKIKNIFNNLMVEGIVSKDNKKKKLFKEYVNSVNKNRILKEQFLVYSNIESKSEVDRGKAKEYVQANINVLKKFPKSDISKVNLKLAESVLFEKGIFSGSDSLKELYENISTLVFLDSNLKNVDAILEATDKVVDYIVGNQKRDIHESEFLPTSILSTIHVDKFNEKYGTLSEDEKTILKAIMESDYDSKRDMFKNLSRECVDLVDNHLTESTTETKEKLLMTKDRILRLEYIEESFIDDISKLITLKSDLQE